MPDVERWITFYTRESAAARSTLDLRPLYYSYLQPSLRLTHEVILRESPCFNIPRCGPPLLLSYGDQETLEIKRQGTEFFESWQANGLPGELRVQDGKNHFSVIEDLNDANSAFGNAVTDFMARCERKPGAGPSFAGG